MSGLSPAVRALLLSFLDSEAETDAIFTGWGLRHSALLNVLEEKGLLTREEYFAAVKGREAGQAVDALLDPKTEARKNERARLRRMLEEEQ